MHAKVTVACMCVFVCLTLYLTICLALTCLKEVMLLYSQCALPATECAIPLVNNKTLKFFVCVWCRP